MVDCDTIVHDMRQAALVSAGQGNDFARRANHYARLYRDSGGNHVFALLAGHGAMWAHAYITNALRAGAILTTLRYLDRRRRAAFWRRMVDFADAFRSIHQQVYAEVLITWKMSGDPELRSVAAAYLGEQQLDLLLRCHHARENGYLLDLDHRRALFDALFAWEQERIVGDQVIDAFSAMQCPVVTAVARRPLVRFGYFPIGGILVFSDFTQRSDRVLQGAKAYGMGEQVGWDTVETVLRNAAVKNAIVRSEKDCPLAAWLSAGAAI